MNIGFDAKRLFNNYTGLGNYSRTLVKNMCKYHPAHQYHLYSPKFVENPKTEFVNSNPNIFVHLPTFAPKSIWRSFLPKESLGKFKIDVFHGLSHELPFGINKKNVLSVVTIHDLIFKIYPETYPYFDRKIYDLKFSYSCRHADLVLAISEQTKIDIIKHYRIPEDKIQVLYQTCDDVYMQPQSLEASMVLSKYSLRRKDYLIYVGAIAERKNILNLIKALSKFPSLDRPTLVLVGNGGEYLNDCKKLAYDLKVENSIKWLTGVNDNAELKVLYENSIALVYPSVYEGFGIPIVEALFCKVPVLTSNTSCLPEAGGPNSIYFDPKEPSDMYEKIRLLVHDHNLQLEVSEKGFKYVKDNFDPQKLSSRLEQLYLNL